jgi:hypothetical protein
MGWFCRETDFTRLLQRELIRVHAPMILLVQSLFWQEA